MVTPEPPATQPPGPTLTIGDLAARTGVATATLRMWESRHGFPVPTRLDSGHRRYGERDVEQVQEVLRRRESGTRLEVAIASVRLREAAEDAGPGAPSVFATLRRLHPHLQPRRLRKSTLLALSWAIEDECLARAGRARVFGAFQQERFYRAAEDRWRELARVARSTVVLAALAGEPDPVPGTTFVHLPEDAPMRREWAVVCDAADHPAVLTAWELPGQSTVRRPGPVVRVGVDRRARRRTRRGPGVRAGDPAARSPRGRVPALRARGRTCRPHRWSWCRRRRC